jgi:hypothetical protein
VFSSLISLVCDMQVQCTEVDKTGDSENGNVVHRTYGIEHHK